MGGLRFFCCMTLGTSLAWGSSAFAQRRPDVTQEIPLSPMHGAPFAVPPAAGVVRLAVVELADHLVDGRRSERSGGHVDASFGLTNVFAARLSLPVVAGGRAVAAGSGLAAFSITSAARVGSVYARLVLELGLVLPAAAAPWAPSAVVPVARDEFGGEAVGSVILGHRSGLAIVPWVALPRGYGVEFAFASPRSPVALRAGVEVPSAHGAPPSFVAGASLRLAPRVELAVFTAIPVRADATSTVAAAPLLGLGVRFDVSTTPRHTYADARGDVARVSSLSELGALAVAGKVTLVELGAAWCEPCRVAEPRLLALAAEEPRLAVRFVDVDEVPRASEVVGRSDLPLFVVLAEDGHELGRLIGWNEASLRRLVTEALSQ